MTKTKLIACEMVRPEIEYLFRELGFTYETSWIEPALHNIPQKLHDKLQEILDSLTDCTRVLMPFGDCGNATRKLRTSDFELIIPRVDDCLTLMLGSYERRRKISAEAGTYYLTLGWLKQDMNIFAEYDRSVKKYGEKTAKWIMDAMFKNYKRIVLIDTGIGHVDELLSYSEPLKRIFNLDICPLKGGLDYLRQLMTGPWNEKNFIFIKPFSQVPNLILP
jgi:hypothetical protein